VLRLDKGWQETWDGTNWVAGDKWEATNAANGLAGATVHNLGSFTIDNGKTTDTGFLTTGANSSLVFRDAGDYLVSVTQKMSAGATGRTFASLEDANSGGVVIARSSYAVAEDVTTVIDVITVTAGQSIFPKFFHSNGSTVNLTGRIKVKRLLT
jgi:hypothetical protein